MTALIGRAAAYLPAETRHPGRLGSAIATLDILRWCVGGRCGVGEKNVEDGTSAGGAVGALAVIETLRSSATVEATVTASGTGSGSKGVRLNQAMLRGTFAFLCDLCVSNAMELEAEC